MAGKMARARRTLLGEQPRVEPVTDSATAGTEDQETECLEPGQPGVPDALSSRGVARGYWRRAKSATTSR